MTSFYKVIRAFLVLIQILSFGLIIVIPMILWSILGEENGLILNNLTNILKAIVFLIGCVATIPFLISFQFFLDSKEKTLQSKIFLVDEWDAINIFNKICAFNPSAKQSQINILSLFFKVQNEDILLDLNVSDDDWGKTIETARKRDFKEKIAIIDILYKLAVADDGIKNDEWDFILYVTRSLGINKHWQESYRRRYESLRTDFGSEKQSDSISKKSKAVNNELYAVLGLGVSANLKQIRMAYHKLALQYHPDLPKNANRVNHCIKRMAEINKAYESLMGEKQA